MKNDRLIRRSVLLFVGLLLLGLQRTYAGTPALTLAAGKTGISSNELGFARNFNFYMDPAGYPRAVSAGETIFMMGSWPSGNNPTMSDDKSNAWAAAPSCTDGTGLSHGFFYAANAAAGTSVITESHGSTVQNGVFDWAHFYNMATSGSADGSSCKTGVTPSNNNSPNITGSSFTTTASGDLILICVYVESSQLNTPNTISSVVFPSGFTGLSVDTTYGHACAYEVQSAAGPFTPTFTVSQNSHNSFTIMSAAFQSGSGGSAPQSGASILLSEMHYVGAAGQTDTVNLPCPSGTTNVTVLDDAGSLSSVRDSSSSSWSAVTISGNFFGPIFYTNNPTISQNTYTVTMSFRSTGNWELVGLYCLGGTNGVDTSAAAQNNSTGVTSGAVTDSTTANTTTITDMPSISVAAGDLVLDTGTMGVGPVESCVTGHCVYDYVGSTTWSNGDNESYANGDLQAHYYASAAGTANFEFNVVATGAGISGLAIAYKPSGSVSQNPPVAPTNLQIAVH
jgi:hypothetical protein